MRKIVDSRAGNSRRNGSLSYGLGTTRLYSEKNEMFLGKKSEVRRVGETVFVAQLDSAVNQAEQLHDQVTRRKTRIAQIALRLERV
jgi:hypothetical protein